MPQENGRRPARLVSLLLRGWNKLWLPIASRPQMDIMPFIMDGDELPTLEQLKQRGDRAAIRGHLIIAEMDDLIQALTPKSPKVDDPLLDERSPDWFIVWGNAYRDPLKSSLTTGVGQLGASRRLTAPPHLAR